MSNTVKKTLLVLYVSPSKDGNSACLVHRFLKGVNKEVYKVKEFYLNDLHLPYFTNENRKADPADPECTDMRMLIDAIDAAEHVVITYPVWNFGVPGVLKNLLDRCSVSGRVWSEEKKKKVPGWKGKRFYLFFTQGAPWYGVPLDSLATIQTIFTLWYFGAKAKLVGFATNCGNGSKCVIEDRLSLMEKMERKGSELFGS